MFTHLDRHLGSLWTNAIKIRLVNVNCLPFRAENSKSPIHLAEFYMIEAEKSFVESIEDVAICIESMIKSVTRDVLDRCEADVLNATPGRCQGDYSWLDKPFPTLTYAEAIHIIDQHRDVFKSSVNGNDGINKEKELFLVKHVGTPVFIVDWPKAMKPFYMRQSQQNPNNVRTWFLGWSDGKVFYFLYESPRIVRRDVLNIL